MATQADSPTAPAPDAPQISPLGLTGLLVRFSAQLEDRANHAVLAFSAALDADPPVGVLEISSALSSVFVRFAPDRIARADLIADLQNRLDGTDWSAAPMSRTQRRWDIPVCFAPEYAPQLAETADLLGMSVDETVADLVAHPVRVLAIGFAPGQPYLGMLPERWDIPRLREITPSVPASALVVAVRQLIVFTSNTPTGWRHVGQTAFRPFRAESDTPFPLLPGDVLHFAPVSSESFDRICTSCTDGSGGAKLTVET